MEKEVKKEKVGVQYLFSLAGRDNKRSLYIAIFLSSLSGIASFVPYVMVFRTILLLFQDDVETSKVIMYGVIAVAAILARFLLQAASMAMTHIGAYDVLYAVRKKLCNHIGQINLGFYTDNSTGEIKKVLMEDVERLEKFLAHQIPDITVAIVVPITVLIYLFTVNVPMSLILIVPIILTFVIQAVEMAIAKPVLGKIPKVLGRLNSGIMQFVNGMTVMKTYNVTANSYKEYSEAVNDYNDLWVKTAKVLAPISSIAKVLIESGIFFALPLGGYLYLKGSLELGEYIFFIIMSIVFLSSYNNILNFAQIFSQISSGIERVKEVMDAEEIHGGSQEVRTEDGYEVAFEKVGFSYDNKQQILEDVNIKMPKGTLTAFVGASGAGKTTAAQLIPRFWDTVTGKITINGVDIKELPTEKLMDMLSFVFQEAFMLNDTIYQNIAIGKENAVQQEVEEAAKAAQIHDFIMSLPNGYETYLGENGVKLSGGEKQRICIARAILKNAPIIIFDEATSFTDGENEHKIQMALDRLLKGKTTIMIAHRLHTIINADQICVFQEGNIVEKGKHTELLEQQGIYNQMWNDYIAQE